MSAGKENTERIEELTLALQASEARFRNFLIGNADGIIILNESGVIRLANPAATKLFDRTEEQLLGEDFAFPMVPGATTELNIDRQGETRVVEARVASTEWEGKPARILTLRDITERLRSEKELLKMYRAVLDSPNMVIITDPHGAIEFVNPRFTEITGYTLPEVAGKTPSFLQSDKVRPEVYEEMRQAIRSCRVWRSELVSTKKNGELYWESVAIAPVRDPDGEVANFMAICVDITQQKRLEEELKKSGQQKELILASAGEGIVGLDKNGLQTFVNSSAAGMLGFSVYELVGQQSHAQWHYARPDGSDYPADQCPVYAAYMDGTVHTGEETFWRKDGTSFPVRFTSRPIYSDGAIVGAVLTFNDITDRIRDEENIRRLNEELAVRAAELEAANQELEAFNYTVAHDLRQPLNVICSYCQAMEMLCGSSLKDECKGYVKETYNGALRMNQLIEALLSFSLMGHVEPYRETFDLGALAQEIFAMLKLANPERQVDFRTAGDGIVADADPKLLRVVLNNLLSNAWKYTGMRTEAVIEFGMTNSDKNPVYFVRDNGAGFHRQDADRLFLPFQRLSGPEQFKGFGIGLATVERIIRRHGGKVWAEGDPDKGATFFFTLQS